MPATIPGEEEVGVQKRCTRCGDWWPPDTDFWFLVTKARGRRTLHSWCRACNYEARNALRRRSS